MCLAMYLFTDNILPETKWDEENPGAYVEKVSDEKDRNALKWNVENKNMYYIGSRQGCGCGWSVLSEFDDQEEQDGKREDRKKLRDLLATIADIENSWMVVCWEGDQGNELLEEEKITLTEIENVEYEFEELRKYVFC